MIRSIFLGSFNPPHIGHASVLKSVVDSVLYNSDGNAFIVDKIHVIPCWKNPNKMNTIDFNDRYNMCKMSFDGISDKIFVDDIENVIRPNYTFYLIEYFRHTYGDFWWIITPETFYEMIRGEWKNGDDLIENNKFIILSDGSGVDENNIIDHFKRRYLDSNIKNICFLNLKCEHDIHSTNIRNLVKSGNSISKYVNKNTEDYILKNNLYKL